MMKKTNRVPSYDSPEYRSWWESVVGSLFMNKTKKTKAPDFDGVAYRSWYGSTTKRLERLAPFFDEGILTCGDVDHIERDLIKLDYHAYALEKLVSRRLPEKKSAKIRAL